MGADKLYVTVDPVSGVDPEVVRDGMPTGGFFRWTRTRRGLVQCCRHSHDRGIVERMLEPVLDRVRRVAMVEVADTAMMGEGFLYERVGDELVLVDRTVGGEDYGDDVVRYLDWRYEFDANRH